MFNTNFIFTYALSKKIFLALHNITCLNYYLKFCEVRKYTVCLEQAHTIIFLILLILENSKKCAMEDNKNWINYPLNTFYYQIFLKYISF